jgi:hypothetical protein
MFSPFTTSPYGIPMSGPGVLEHMSTDMLHAVKKDQGLSEHKKESVLALLDNPEVFKRFASGGLGVALTRSLSSFQQLSKPAQILVSLAGFGLGRSIYDLMHTPEKFTIHNESTGITKIKL